MIFIKKIRFIIFIPKIMFKKKLKMQINEKFLKMKI